MKHSQATNVIIMKQKSYFFPHSSHWYRFLIFIFNVNIGLYAFWSKFKGKYIKRVQFQTLNFLALPLILNRIPWVFFPAWIFKINPIPYNSYFHVCLIPSRFAFKGG